MAPLIATPAPEPTSAGDWKRALPTLASARVVLRQMRQYDAASLHANVTTSEVARFISPPPNTVEGFERFIAWAHREQTRGTYACFAIVPAGADAAVGLFQLRSLEAGFATAEWGFAMTSRFWGTGLFLDSASLVLDFAFDIVGVRRLEARSSVVNGRGNGALRKLGAVQECVLRQSFSRDGRRHNQALWSILADEWRAERQDRPAIASFVN